MSSKNSTKGNGKRRRVDKFYQLAKEQGYRARSAFKLIQLEKKYNFLTTARAVIDLCAAPGGWMQVARKYAPISAVVIGVDLVAISPIRGCVALQADITTAQCRALLQREMRDWKVDVVLNDGAPSMGATWVQDAYTQSELTLHALRLAAEFLMPGGTFVTKVFRSKDYNAIYWVLTQLFDKVEATKPVASRDISAEIYIVCKGFKAPKKIDPRLLDPKHVFKEINPSTPAANLLKVKKQRANRDGYDDNIGQIVHKRACITQFLDAANPGQFLGLFHEITFDPATPLALDHMGRVFGSKDGGFDDADIIPEAVRESTGKVEQIVSREAARLAQSQEKTAEKRETAAAAMSRDATIAFVKAHPQTPASLVAQLRDIRLMSRSDLKKVLLWRERMRRARQELLDSLKPRASNGDGGGDDGDELNSDEKLERELNAELDRADARRQRRQRRLRRARAKQRAREALGMTAPFLADNTENREIFDLASIEKLDEATQAIVRRGLDGYADKRAALDEQLAEEADIAKSIRFRLGPDLADVDSDSLSKDGQVDDLLEVMYQDYKEASRIRAAADRSKKLRGISEHKRLLMLQEAEAELVDEDRARRQAAADVDAELRFGKTGAGAGAAAASKKRRRRGRGDGSGSESADESGSSELDDSEERRKLDALSAVPATVRAAMWYDQSLFDGIDGVPPPPVPLYDDDDDDEDEDDDVRSNHGDDDDDDDADGGPNRKRKAKQMSAIERADQRRSRMTSFDRSDSDDDDFGGGSLSGDDDDDDEARFGAFGVAAKGQHDALDELFVTKEEEEQDLASESDSINERKVKTRKSKRELAREAKRNELTGQKSDKPDDTAGFEIVPIDESSEDTDSDKGGQDAQLEALAYARALVNGRRRRDELEDNAFNRRAFADTEAAPSWFVDDERAHMQFSLPVTREDLIAVRAQEIGLNARPIKRIVEAKMRKQRRAKRRTERMKLQANAIADQTDIDDRSKMRLLEKLYRGGSKGKKEKRERQYVVATRSGTARKAVKGASKGPTVRVDARMKKEKRAKKAQGKRAKKVSRSANKKKAQRH